MSRRCAISQIETDFGPHGEQFSKKKISDFSDMLTDEQGKPPLKRKETARVLAFPYDAICMTKPS